MPEDNPNRRSSSFLTSAPGLLTGIAAVVTAAIGAYAVFHHPAPTANLFVNPNTVQKGQSSTLTWQTSDANAVSIAEIGPVPPNGSQQITPESSITYHLTAAGAGGNRQATAEISVTPSETQGRKSDESSSQDTKLLKPHSGPEVLSGDWRGTLQPPPVPLIFHINLGGKSTVDTPNQNIYGTLVTVTANGSDVQIDGSGGGGAFHGTLQGATINGSFSTSHDTVPMILTRTGAANPDGAGGDWKGVLNSLAVPLILHFNVAAESTIDFPTQNFFGMQVNVTIASDAVEFDVPGASMTFHGSIQGAKITGTVSQLGQNAPLTLVKR